MNIFGLKIPLNYSRTMLAAHLAIVSGVLAVFGVDVPADALVASYGALIDATQLLIGAGNEAYLLVNGVILAALRVITSSPLASGLKGLLGMK